MIALLGNGEILVTNVTALTLDCDNTQITRQGCLQCVQKLPCGCAIKLLAENSTHPKSFQLANRKGCSPYSNTTLIRRTINLAALQAFFNQKALGDLTGNTYLSTELPVSLPAFRHFENKFQQFLSVNTQTSHNLHKFSQRVKNDSVIYNDLADILVHRYANLQTDGFDLLVNPYYTTATWWLLWTSVIGAYVALAISVLLCYKIKPTGSILPFFASSTATSNFPTYLNFADKPTLAPRNFNATQLPLTSAFDRDMIFDFIIIIILCTIVIAALFWWLYRIYEGKQNLHIVLEIGTDTHCYRVRCMKLSSVIYAYTFFSFGVYCIITCCRNFPSLSVDFLAFILD